MSALTSDGRDPRGYYPDGIPDLSAVLAALLRAAGESPYIADMAGGNFALVVDVTPRDPAEPDTYPSRVVAGNGDGGLPAADGQDFAYQTHVAVEPLTDLTSDGSEPWRDVLFADHPLTADVIADAMLTALRAERAALKG